MEGVLDGIDDVIYVADPRTYELLHVNDAFKRIWGGDVIGKKCYRVLQNREAPCPFCTNDRITLPPMAPRARLPGPAPKARILKASCAASAGISGPERSWTS